MSLTTGRGPLSGRPGGRFTAPVPDGVAYVEPFLRRLRGIVGGRTVIDSEQVLLVHRPGRAPLYALPTAAVGELPAEPVAEADGYVAVPWEAVDEWLEEEEPIVGHPRNPYHRVDCIPTRRRLRVTVGGTVLVDTDDTLGVYETSLAPKLYVAKAHVQMDILVASETTTYCPYKGWTTYWNAVVDGATVADVAWSYETPLPEFSRGGGLLSFELDRVTADLNLPGA